MVKLGEIEPKPLPKGRTRILVTVPLAAKEGVCNYVADTLIKLREDERYAVDVKYPCSSPSEVARSMGLLLFLEGEYDHWLTIDSDNPPACNPLDLVDVLEEKPIIGFPTPICQHTREGKATLSWNAYNRRAMAFDSVRPEGREGLTWEKVDAIGTGCVLISGKVFQQREMRKAPFGRVWKEDGTVQLGSDLAFCERAAHWGFHTWVNWAYRCNHFNVVNLTEMMGLQRDAWNAGHAVGEQKGEQAGRLFAERMGVAEPERWPETNRDDRQRAARRGEGPDSQLFNVGSRANSWLVGEGKTQVKKVFNDNEDGVVAYHGEFRADTEFKKLPWFAQWTDYGPDWFITDLYPQESRLDRMAPTLSEERRRELAGEALSIILDMLVRGYAHRDFHVKNLYLVDGQLKLKDFETLQKYEADVPGLSSCYDVTGEGLESPWAAGGICYTQDVPWSVSTVLGVSYTEARNQLREILEKELFDVSATFKTSKGRHTPAQRKIYTGFWLNGFMVDPEDAQRDCAKRHERFGSSGILPGRSVLDLGCHVGGMLFEAQQFQPGDCVGLEFDNDKVMAARRVAAFCDVDVRFLRQDLDEPIGGIRGVSSFDVVMCLALEAHVQDPQRLYRLLGELTNDVLFFEGNATTDIGEVEFALKANGFVTVHNLGVCDDDSRPENNCRPLLRAWKEGRHLVGYMGP